MVAVIDPAHPGQLTLATEPYDPEVAGVISGANGVRPGMLMGQRATAADGDRDVDLADLAALLGAYGVCAGDPNYDPNADFDASGCVDLWDLLRLLSNYGAGT